MLNTYLRQPWEPPHECPNKGHGRIEVRRCRAYKSVDRLYNANAWKDVTSFVVLERVRTVSERTTTERVCYISSLPADAKRIAQAVRGREPYALVSGRPVR